ncbi:hypothetical protein RF11_04656 [Thelohanellus kitauei]|uniref:Uncharacterized protein n=1 Tax=Thelohanellus kitauei TaxID=669202 RepID=A0A0C2M2E9_THEKT|nr:hypothetical protein RF11_04656 [Thelohanellus kitauei]
MKESENSRYFVIKKMKEPAMQNPIIIPMDHCKKFLDILDEIYWFGECLYFTGSEPQHEGSLITLKRTMHTKAGRKYYFDAWIDDDIFGLKISYKYLESGDCIDIDLLSLAHFLEIIKKFQNEYPSLTGNDDLDLKINSRFNNQRRFPVRGCRSNKRVFFPMPIPRSGVESLHNINVQPNLNDSEERTNTDWLNVCSYSAPRSITYNAQKHPLQIKKMGKFIMRLRWMIEGLMKTTLHIPSEPVTQSEDVLVEINDTLSEVSSDEEKSPES